jgi:hypothetical protein
MLAHGSAVGVGGGIVISQGVRPHSDAVGIGGYCHFVLVFVFSPRRGVSQATLNCNVA